MNIIKLADVTESGFYWARFDEHRGWKLAWVSRVASHPNHPKHNKWEVNPHAGTCGPEFHSIGTDPQLIGPIQAPPR